MRILRSLAATLLWPVWRVVIRYWPVRDPWEKLPGLVPVQWFGPGSRMGVQWYFTGHSKVRVESLEDVQRWLWRCEYVPDPVLFREPDYWQHPQTFEQLKRGDCEDFALWAWRKLVELEYDAEFVVGRCQAEADSGSLRHGRHAWLVFTREGKPHIYEPTVRDYKEALQPLEAVRHRYVPEFAIGPNLRPFQYAGYFLTLKERIYRPQERPVG